MSARDTRSDSSRRARLHRRLWSLSLAGLTLVARDTLAQAPTVSVARVGALAVTAEPGARVTLAFKVTSRAQSDRLVATAATIPPAWRLVIPDSAMALPAGSSELALLSIAIPSGARAGSYTVRFAARPDDGATGAVSDSIVVRIAERRQMAARLVSAPRFVRAGDSYDAGFSVQNVGNAPASVRLELTGHRGIDSRLDSTTLVLEPGEERVVRASIRTNRRETQKLVHRVGVVATTAGDSTTRATAVAVVEVVPQRTDGASLRHHLPVTLDLSTTDQDGRLTPELRGGGYLTSSRTDEVDFVLRRRSPGNFLGAQDEYRINLGRPGRYEIQLGDQRLGSSRILQPFRAGAGALAELRLGAFTLGSHTQHDRRSWGLTRDYQSGGSIDYRLPGERGSVGGAYLTRSGIDAGTIWASRGIADLVRGTLLEWEYGLGDGARGRGDASFLRLSGDAGPLVYGLTRDDADTTYPGMGAGARQTSGMARLRVTQQIILFGNATQDTRHVLGGGTQHRREIESGADLTSFFGVAYRQVRDTGGAVGRAKTGRSARAFLNLPFRFIGLGARVELGRSTFDTAPSRQVPFHRFGGRASLNIKGQSLGASIERMDGTPVYGFSSVEQTMTQVSASIRLTGTTRLNVSFNGTQSPASAGGKYTLLDIGLDQRLARGHQVEWRGQSIGYGSVPGAFSRESRQHARYVLPLAVPLLRSGDVGSVNVVIRDAAGRPVSGVLVRVGADARITNAAGRASFVGLTPGTHYVDLDRLTMGPGRIVTPTLPLAVDVEGGTRQSVDLTFVSGAQVTGTVRLLEFGPRRLDAPDTVFDAGGQAGVRLQLINNGDTLRTVSNGGGRFRFGDVRAGNWTLIVLPTDLPVQHRPREPRVALDLVPGQNREVTLHLDPQRVDVQFIQNAELPVTAAESPPRAAVPVAPTSHVVRREEVGLMEVARTVYGDAGLWSKLWVANRRELPRPEAVRVGQRLVVPPRAALTADEREARNRYFSNLRRRARPGWPVADSTWQPPVVQHWYTVTRHDVSLTRIAAAMYDNGELWPKIWLANLDQLESPESLRPGRRLRVPEPAPLTREEIAARNAYLARQR